MPTAPEKLWTIEETADYLGKPVATLYAWRKRRNRRTGQPYGPQAAKVGKSLRYDPAHVRAWLVAQGAVLEVA